MIACKRWRGACVGLAVLALHPAAAANLPPSRDAADEAFDAALSLAYTTNPTLAAERKRLRETDEDVPKALSGWRPHVNLSGNVGASAVFDSIDTAHQPERRVPQQVELSVTQPIYTGGRVRAQVNQANALVQAERAALQASEASVLLDAATAFLDVALDQHILELQLHQETVLRRTLTATQQEEAAGAVTQADVAQSQARFADQRAVVAQAASVLSVARARFQQVVGAPPGQLDVPLRRLDLPASLDRALGMIGNNFDVLQSKAAQEASRQGIDIARAGLRPRLSFEVEGARVKETDVQVAHQRDDIAEATLQLTFPIYQGGENAAEIRQAKEAASRSLLQIDVALRAAREQVQAAWAQLEAARMRVDQYRISFDANRLAERGIVRQQSVGARTLIEVLNAQQERLGAEINEITAEHDAYVAGLRLQAATGVLSAAALRLDVMPYDPLRHYWETRDRWYGTTPAP